MSQACFFSGEVKVTILDVLGPGYIITFMFVAMDVATTPGDMLAPLGWCTRNGAVCGGRFCGGFYVFFNGIFMDYSYFIESDDGTIYRNALYLMVKTMVSD